MRRAAFENTAKASSKTLDRLVRTDRRVTGWWSEGPNGYWLDLAPGWHLDGCITVHGWKVKDVVSDLTAVYRCEPLCDECKGRGATP